MKNIRYVYLLCLVLLFLANWKILPSQDLYIDNPSIFTIIISVLAAFLFFKFLAPTKSERKGTFTEILLTVLIFFVFLFFNLFYSVDNEMEILKKSGITTTAIITDKTHLRIKRSETFDFSIAFKNNNGKAVQAKVSTNSSDYDKYIIGQEILVMYSSENNQLVHIYEEEKTDATESNNRLLTIKELLKLTAYPKDSLTNILYKINSNWKFNAMDSSWADSSNQIHIELTPKKKLILTTFERFQDLDSGNPLFPYKYVEQFRDIGFKEKKSDTVFWYTNSEFNAQIIALTRTTGDDLNIGQRIIIERK